MKSIRKALLAAPALLWLVAPTASWACACGCGIFEVGANAIMPSTSGTNLFVEYDFMDQNKNWSGTKSAPADDNDDKEIKTDFFTLGGQTMLNEDWSVMAQVPVSNRLFKTDDGAGVEAFTHAAFGDLRLKAIYTGFSSEKTTGAIFGVKLPTGDFTYANFDRDTEIGSGSTDALLGLYHSGALASGSPWVWFGQVMWDKPLASQGGYTPGAEFDAALGVAYTNVAISGDVAITPTLQILGSSRIRDGGPEAAPSDSGYDRLLLSPGVEVAFNRWKLYGDVELPIYQRMNGNQLVAQQLFKFVVSYDLEG